MAARDGDRLGEFELLFELASGGMATIYVARQLGAAGFERLVVIKRVHPHLLKDPAFHEMFRDEGRVSALIRSPHVVPTLDVGEVDGSLFLVLEYVESVSLKTLIDLARDKDVAIPPAIVARIVSDVLSGLHAAHEATGIRGEPLGIVHRDVSPHNILVGSDGSSRIIDFGVAKAATRIAQTDSNSLKGKLKYMSPEQIKRGSLDRRSDIFATGIILFEALTGKRFFEGENEAEVVLKVLLHGQDDLRKSQLVPQFAPLLDKALAADRDERFQTALEFQEALEGVQRPAPTRDVARIVEELGGASIVRRRGQLQEALDGRARAESVDAAAHLEAIAEVELQKEEDARRAAELELAVDGRNSETLAVLGHEPGEDALPTVPTISAPREALFASRQRKWIAGVLVATLAIVLVGALLPTRSTPRAEDALTQGSAAVASTVPSAQSDLDPITPTLTNASSAPVTTATVSAPTVRRDGRPSFRPHARPRPAGANSVELHSNPYGH